MRIERVDDKTVKCFLSNEELEEYDIDYKDFILRSEKAKEVVQEIIEQAEEEVGYKPPKFAFDLQIMMLPDQGLVLTFSEREPGDFKEGEQILECLKDMKEILQRNKERMAALGDASEKQSGESGKSAKAQKQEQPIVTRPEEAVFAFETLRAVMEYAAVLPVNLRVYSVLYQMNDIYYLYMQKGNASYERYSRACVQAMEFAGLYTAEADRLLHLQEHGECIIAEQALKKLRLK
uniref:adaptor protein MecA n=1 Tax=Acetatifactor sp. TaxID=1872090 RepID=UPI00405625E2